MSVRDLCNLDYTEICISASGMGLSMYFSHKTFFLFYVVSSLLSATVKYYIFHNIYLKSLGYP